MEVRCFAHGFLSAEACLKNISLDFKGGNSESN
jgi:hypothetical protein